MTISITGKGISIGPGDSSGGVSSLNSLTGALNIIAGANITVTPSGSSITIASSGGGSPGGTNGQIQYNNSGAFAGANIVYSVVSSRANLSSPAGAIRFSSGILSQNSFYDYNGHGGLILTSPFPYTTGMAFVGEDGSNVAQFSCFSQGDDYWNFVLSDANTGALLARQAFGNDATASFEVGSGAVIICGGNGTGFGNTFLRVGDDPNEVGTILGDPFGGLVQIASATVTVNNTYNFPGTSSPGYGGSGDTNQIFAVYDNNTGGGRNAGNFSFQITTADSNGYGDYVQTIYNLIDNGNGQAGVGRGGTLNGGSPQYALDIYDFAGTGTDIGNSTTGAWSISASGSGFFSGMDISGSAYFASINSVAAGAASAPVVSLTGSVYTGGSGTTTQPYIYYNKGASAPTTWSTAGTLFGANMASGYAGNLLDFHINGGASVFSVNFAGNVVTSGSISSNAQLITSNSATAFTVGPNGTTNPVFNVNANTGSSATGITVVGNSATNGVAINTTSSSTSEVLSISSKGTGALFLNSAGTGPVTVGGVLNAASSTVGGILTSSSTLSNSGGTTVTITGSDTVLLGKKVKAAGFSGGSTGMYLDTGTVGFLSSFGTNGNSTAAFMGWNSGASIAASGFVSGWSNVGFGSSFTSATNDTGLSRVSAGVIGVGTGAAASTAGSLSLTNITASGNLSMTTAGQGIIIKSGSNARIGTGTLSGGTLTVANTSVTANTRVFLQDTSTSVTNVGTLTVVTTAGTGFVVTSTLALDASTFNWFLVESQ